MKATKLFRASVIVTDTVPYVRECPNCGGDAILDDYTKREDGKERAVYYCYNCSRGHMQLFATNS